MPCVRCYKPHCMHVLLHSVPKYPLRHSKEYGGEICQHLMCPTCQFRNRQTFTAPLNPIIANGFLTTLQVSEGMVVPTKTCAHAMQYWYIKFQAFCSTCIYASVNVKNKSYFIDKLKFVIITNVHRHLFPRLILYRHEALATLAK